MITVYSVKPDILFFPNSFDLKRGSYISPLTHRMTFKLKKGYMQEYLFKLLIYWLKMKLYIST
jgi:hypothetical protein